MRLEHNTNHIPQDINNEYLNQLSLADLCDLLSDKTLELLKSISDKEVDRFTLRLQMSEVEKIQSAWKRKTNNG